MQDLSELEQHVLTELLEKGPLQYPARQIRQATSFFGLTHRRQSDLFEALGRLEREGLIVKDPGQRRRILGSKGKRYYTSRIVIYTAVRSGLVEA